MQGKTVLITGATSGIGQETARALAQLGATVVVAGRNPGKTAATVADIQASAGSATVDSLLADLSDQRQVRQLAREFKRRYGRLDVLVNNAGVVSRQRQETADGYELTFAVNHLSYFLLTNLLLDTLTATAAEHGSARIVNVGSRAHKRVRGLDFDDLHSRRFYFSLRAYGRSKLANVLFTYELARRLAGTRVTANVVHPGIVATGMGGNNGALYDLAYFCMHRIALTPIQGAEPIIRLAAAPELEGVSGKYFDRHRPIESSPASYDQEAARRLWQMSEAMTEPRAEVSI